MRWLLDDLDGPEPTESLVGVALKADPHTARPHGLTWDSYVGVT